MVVVVVVVVIYFGEFKALWKVNRVTLVDQISALSLVFMLRVGWILLR